jgi:hypothetical protein
MMHFIHAAAANQTGDDDPADAIIRHIAARLVQQSRPILRANEDTR